MFDVIFLKFIIVFVISFLFGIERQLSNKSTGLGTFVFVATGSCALGILSSIIYPENTLIIVGGVVTGVGFLGAGALIKADDKIFGFNTAASIWCFSIIGLCIGFGLFKLGIITYSLCWIVLGADRFLESKGVGSYQRKIFIKTNKIVKKEDVISLFKEHKWKLLSMVIDKKEKNGNFAYLIKCPRSYINNLREDFESKDWVELFKIE